MSLGWIAAVVIAVVLSATLWLTRHFGDLPFKPLARLIVDLGTGVSHGSRSGPDFIIWPDGTRLVYLSQNRLLTRRLDQSDARELAGTEEAFAPFFSPDGRWVAFFAGEKLKKISVEGGAAIPLCNVVNGRGGAWGEDGNIIEAPGGVTGLEQVPSTGGTPTPPNWRKGKPHTVGRRSYLAVRLCCSRRTTGVTVPATMPPRLKSYLLGVWQAFQMDFLSAHAVQVDVPGFGLNAQKLY